MSREQNGNSPPTDGKVIPLSRDGKDRTNQAAKGGLTDEQRENGRNSPRRRTTAIQRAQRRHEILARAAAGMTEEQIAQQLDMTQQSVSSILTRALDKMREADTALTERRRELQLHRLDVMLQRLWPGVLQGDVASVREARQIVESQAKLSGTNAPAKVQHSGTLEHIGIDMSEIRELEKAWRDAEGTITDAQVVEDERRMLPSS